MVLYPGIEVDDALKIPEQIELWLVTACSSAGCCQFQVIHKSD
jgi:hypothetical protein